MSNLKTSHEMEEGGMIDVPKTSRNFKTGAWRTFKPVIDESKCIHCMQCVINCPESCINITKDKKEVPSIWIIVKDALSVQRFVR